MMTMFTASLIGYVSVVVGTGFIIWLPYLIKRLKERIFG